MDWTRSGQAEAHAGATDELEIPSEFQPAHRHQQPSPEPYPEPDYSQILSPERLQISSGRNHSRGNRRDGPRLHTHFRRDTGMKRVSEDTLTKEEGISANPDARDRGEEPRKMATSAQLARRKLAQPKSRLNRSTTPSAPASIAAPVSSMGASNPFASAGFGQSQQTSFQPPAGGFTFGSDNNTSLSFPPANTQNSQATGFSAPGGSFSFSFGQNNASNPTPSNPFASLNGNNNNNAPAMNGNANDTMMDASPQKQAAPTAFSFGNSAAPALNFGSQSTSTAPVFGGLFGASKPEEPKTNGSVFGQSQQNGQNGASSNIFGQTASAATTTSSLFPTSTTTSSAPSLFGATTPPVTTDAPTAKPLFSWGQPAATSTPEPSMSTTQSTGFSFGQPTSTTKPSLFGAPSAGVKSPNSEEPPAKKSLFSFGTPATNDTSKGTDSPAPASSPAFGHSTSTTSNPFGSSTSVFAQPQKSVSPEKESQSEPVAEQPKANPFAGMFGSQATPAAPAPTPKFNFGQSTTPAKPAESSPLPDTSAASSAPPKSVFNFPAAPSTPATNLFAPKPTTPATTSNLFNLNKPADITSEPQTEPKPKTSTLFGQPSATPSKPPPSENAAKSDQTGSNATPANPFASLGTSKLPSSVDSSKRRRSSDESTPAPKKSLFGNSLTPSANPSNTTSSTPTTSSKPKFVEKEAPAGFPKPQYAEEASTQPDVKRTVSTFGPPQIPRGLDPLKYKAYDEAWRLRVLNFQFKKAVAEINPDTHDYATIIQNYLDHREAIGEGLGLYQRAKAGTKRKNGDLDDASILEDSNKKTKASSTQSFTSTPSSTFTPSQTKSGSSNIFGNSAPSVQTHPAQPSGSNATDLFRSMIPGATPNKSTTPPSSPPKKAGFQPTGLQVPTFGSAGKSDFVSAFAKQSEAALKKLEKEEMAKRKAEEFDSDEDDEAEWQKKYDEEQRAKKAKLAGISKGGFTPVVSTEPSRSPSPFTFGAAPTSTNGATKPLFGAAAVKSIEAESGNITEDASGDSGDSGDASDSRDEEQAEEGGDEAEAEEEEEEEEGEPLPDLAPGESLFSRITKVSPTSPKKPTISPGKSTFFSNPPKPAGEPTPSFGSTSGSGFVPATTFNFSATPTTSSRDSPSGGSLFGAAAADVPSKFEGMFGSRPSTPSNADKPRQSLFGTSTASAGDNTWKQGTPIKFGDSKGPTPSIEVSEATPPKPFASLFGNSTPNPTSSSTLTSTGFSFNKPAPGFLGASTHLDAPGSGFSSRATSPGLTDNESVATDADASGAEGEPLTDAQVNLLADTNPGEENEDIIFEAKSKASRIYKKDEIEGTSLNEGWNVVGKGNMRVLKHKDTGKTRIVLRAEPGANILFNDGLNKSMTYSAKPSGAKQGMVVFGRPVTSGPVQTWSFLVGSREKAEELAKVCEENKTN